MDGTLWVIIYSQFSDSCKRLMTIIDQASLDVQFQVLCIDDTNLRKRIANDKKFNIKIVPCILRIEKDSGIASQYEGEKAYELIYTLIERQQAMMQQMIHQQQAPVMHQQQAQQQAQKQAPVIHQQQAPVMHQQQAPVMHQQQSPLHQQQSPLHHQQAPLHHQQQQSRQDKAIIQQSPTDQQAILNTTPIESVVSEDEETNNIIGDRPMGQHRNTTKVSVNTIMASREEALEIETKLAKAKPESDIKPVKTGKKVSVAEIMANKN